MNNVIKKLRVFSTLLVSGAVALSLCTCTKKEGHEVVIPTMEESFYDSNNEGIDDQFETLVDESDNDIEFLNRIEMMLNLMDRIHELNNDVNFDKDFNVYNNNSLMYSTGAYGDPLDNIEQCVIFYEENRDRMSDEEKEIFNEKLCEDYNNIAYYLINRAPERIGDIFLDLAKVVGASTLDLDSIDDIKVYIDTHHLGLSGNGIGWYHYDENDEKKTITFDGANCDVYDLVDAYIKFHERAPFYPELYDNTESVEQLKHYYRKSLKVIKDTVHNDYELVDVPFSNQAIRIKK